MKQSEIQIGQLIFYGSAKSPNWEVLAKDDENPNYVFIKKRLAVYMDKHTLKRVNIGRLRTI